LRNRLIIWGLFVILTFSLAGCQGGNKQVTGGDHSGWKIAAIGHIVYGIYFTEKRAKRIDFSGSWW
jgi:hypothetical protein